MNPIAFLPVSLIDAWAACPDCLAGQLARGEIWFLGSLSHLGAVALPFAGIGALTLVLGRLWPGLRKGRYTTQRSSRSAP